MDNIDFLESKARLAIEIIVGLYAFSWLAPIILDIPRGLRKLYYFLRRCFWFMKKVYRSVDRFLYRILGLDSFKERSYRRKARPHNHNNSRIADEKFKPWMRDYIKTLILWFVGVAWLGGTLFWYRQYGRPYILVGSMMSVLPFFYSFLYLESGQRRQYGKAVEKAARSKFAAILPYGWELIEDRFLDNGGDIDLPLMLNNDEACVVEIKSWRRWDGYLRTRHAIAQVHYQRRSVGASYVVIWLPHAESAFATFHSRVLVVGGNAGYLLRKIQNIIRYEAIIKFPYQPPKGILVYVKSKRFRWNSIAHHWEGRCCEQEVEELQSRIEHGNGTIRILN